MDNFFLTVFLLLVIISLYSILIRRQKTHPKSETHASSQPSNLSSSLSESSSQPNTSTANFQPSQSSSSYLSSPTITSSDNDQTLAQYIQRLGDSNSLNKILPVLNYLTHSDPLIRLRVAEALGKLASINNRRTQVRRAILGLGRLSRDPVLSVRLAAVEALGSIKSPLVIPFLKSAQKDVDSNVIKSASAALNSFKTSPLSSRKKVSNKPKNVVKQFSST